MLQWLAIPIGSAEPARLPSNLQGKSLMAPYLHSLHHVDYMSAFQRCSASRILGVIGQSLCLHHARICT